jgi:alkyl sulfatase BDS1-like metallo-beta-lactamase superfamily hydrolase
VTLIPPTTTVAKTGTEMTIDGVKLVFQLTPGTEAPAEMNFWLPQFKAMWMAENVSHTLHNILTLRGAKVRDPLIWAHFLDETLASWGADIETEFASHHWPTWGNERIRTYLGRQRDLYKYIHDQSVRLMNQGYTGVELSNMVKLPPELAQEWFNRDYYGTVKHNSRAVYQRYMGFFDANPSMLDELPPVEAAAKYVEYMGGADAVLKKARADFDSGSYRWVAMALKHVVFADPNNAAAKYLLADAYEQMGYQAESGAWRSVYLQGAFELRNGVPSGAAAVTASADTLRNMAPDLLFDYFAVRLNPERAAGKKVSLNFHFTDLNQWHSLNVENSVLTHAGRQNPAADATLTLTKQTLDRIQLRETTLDKVIGEGSVTVDGRKAAVGELLGMLDTFPFWFNIVTP